eukprot:6432341-Amphidinium_carterae.1
MAKLLASHGANPTTLTAVAGLDCSTCNRHRVVPPPRPSSVPQNFAFGESLQGDVFHILDSLGESHMVLGLIDAATHLHVARRITAKDAHAMLHTFLEAWVTAFGVPMELKVDADPAFRGTFAEGCGRLGIELLHVPADRHSQLGRIERHNAILRLSLLKLVTEHTIHTSTDLDVVLQAAVNAKNTLARRAGVSPFIAAFGRLPRVPGQLLSDEHDAHLQQGLNADQQVRRAMQLRLSAQRSFLEVQQMEALRGAILRKQPTPSPSSYTPGERIAYYRTRALTRRGHRSKRSGYIAATFISLDTGPRGKSQNAWVLAGGRLVLVDVAQLRPAVGFENWIPTPEDAALLDQAVQGLPPGELPMEYDQPLADLLAEPASASDLSMLPASASDLSTLPAPTIPLPPLDSIDDDEDVESEGHGPPPTPPPSRVPSTPLPSATAAATSAAAGSQTSRIREREEIDAESHSSKAPRTATASVMCTSIPTDGWSVHMLETPLWEWLDEEHSTMAFAPPCGDDGNVVLSASRSGKNFHGELSLLETSDEETRGALSAQSKSGWQAEQNALSAANLKSLQKELPVGFIMQQDSSFVDSFRAAVRKEQASWEEWKPVRQLNPEEAKRVLSDKFLSRRVLRSRMIYRDKNSGSPPLAPKARLVVTGFSDPDLATLRRYSPVLTRLGLYTVLQLFSSSHTDLEPWRLVTGDVATAFLQGTQDRERPVYMHGPRDALIESTGCFGGGSGVLFQIHGNVYGLANAPATFSASVVQKMRSVGFVQHPLDSMLFLKYGMLGESSYTTVVAAAGFHVDDLIMSCHPCFPLSSVRDLFTWGNWTSVEPCSASTITFTGRQLRVLVSGTVVVCQPAFMQTVPVKHATMRGRETDQLVGDSDKTAFRSATGTLQWISSTSRPDISSWCSLLQRATPTLTDLRGLYEAIEFVRETSEQGITINPVPLVGSVLVVYSDSSFANADKGGSQGGMLIALCPETVLRGEAVAGSIVEWKSFKSKRICRSTLAAEAMAAEAALDHAQFSADFLSMALSGSSLRDHKCTIPFVSLTDCKSLYDAVLQSSPCLEEKRTILTTAAIREAVESNNANHPQVPPRLFWLPTEQQMADALTKMSKPLRRSFLSWVMDPTIKLQMTPNGSS